MTLELTSMISGMITMMMMVQITRPALLLDALAAAVGMETGYAGTGCVVDAGMGQLVAFSTAVLGMRQVQAAARWKESSWTPT